MTHLRHPQPKKIQVPPTDGACNGISPHPSSISKRLANCSSATILSPNTLSGLTLDLHQAQIRSTGPFRGSEWEAKMKLSIALSALLITGFVAASTEQASAVVYCQYVEYPVGCVVRPGVVLRPRPVARAVVTPGVGAPGVGVRRGTPMNRGGPVNRVGRR